MLTKIYHRATKAFFSENPNPLVKQSATTVAVVAACFSLFIPGATIVNIPYIIAGGSGALIALGLAYLVTRWEIKARTAVFIPVISLFAVGLFRVGTGGPNSLYSALIILPLIWIAAEPGRKYILFCFIFGSFALAMPFLFGDNQILRPSDVLRFIFGPAIFTVMAAIINEFARTARVRVKATEELVAEKSQLLAESLTREEEVKEAAAALVIAKKLTDSVLNAVTRQAIIGTNLSGLIDVWNPGAELMLGYTEEETVNRRYIHNFHRTYELDNFYKEIGPLIIAENMDPGFAALTEKARVGESDEREWTYLRSDNEEVTVKVAVTPRTDDHGDIAGYIFVANDVTQEREVTKLKDEFVGLISHELRTPLTSILGYLELIKDDDETELTETQITYLGVAERNANRLLRLVGDLLFTAQVESGKFPLLEGVADLTPILAAAVESAKPAADNKHVTLNLDNIYSDCILKGDPLRLAQAVDNLVSNAIKFTPANGSVNLSLQLIDGKAIIRISDTGMGIPKDEMDKLFSRFFRASTATRNAVQGVGLGLTITKAIVTAHGGSLSAESVEGSGTTFVMELPYTFQN